MERREIGAGNETRTRDPDLGKVVLYQLSYSRKRVSKNKIGLFDIPRPVNPQFGRENYKRVIP